MATLKDISLKTGFSTSTVCYALNNDHRIPEETRNKILKCAKAMHYKQKTKGIKSTYQKQIVLCLNSINGIIYTEIFDAIHRVLHLSKCKLVIYVGSAITDLQWLDGLIILNSNVKDEDIREVISRKIPVILMDRDTRIDGASNITLDNYNGVKEIVNKTIEKGAKSFAFIAGPYRSLENEYRFKGYSDALMEHGLSLKNQYFYQGDFTYQSGFNIGLALNSYEKLPNAIICANDEMAQGLMASLKQQKINLGNTIITGFDGIQTEFGNGFITCKYNRMHWGSVVAYKLLELFENKVTDRVKILVDIVEY